MSGFTRRGFIQFSAAAAGAAVAAGGCASLQKGGGDPALADLQPMTDALPPVPAGAAAERRERLRKAMSDAGVDAMLLGPTLNLTYFTGQSWGASERLFGYLQFRDGGAAWISPKFEETRAREITGSDELYTWNEWENPHALVASIVNQRAPRGRLAVDSHVRATHALQITNILGADRVIDGLAVSARVRSVKSEFELARMRRACEITKKAITIVHERLIRPGVTEAQVSEWVNEAQRRLGLVNTWALVLFGPNAAFPHGTKERRPLEEGQFALLDCGGELQHYQSDITRTFFIGKNPSARQRNVYECVRMAQLAALAAARPGVRCEEVDTAARRVIVDGGFGPAATFFTHRLGHGIGLEGHEDPYFCGGNTTILEPGMTLSNEPGIYIPGELGVRLEDILVITRDGAATLGGELAPALQ